VPCFAKLHKPVRNLGCGIRVTFPLSPYAIRILAVLTIGSAFLVVQEQVGDIGPSRSSLGIEGGFPLNKIDRVRSAQPSFEDILYPYPNQGAKLRFRTWWEVQYLEG